MEGEAVELVCRVTVGQQYNTVSMLPVYADWDWERWVGIRKTYLPLLKQERRVEHCRRAISSLAEMVG